MSSSAPVHQNSRGSEWRRWDLHIHTPYSHLNNGFGTDFETYAQTILLRALELNIAGIGVTDYFSIKGYKELRKLVESDDWITERLGLCFTEGIRSLLLLPNVEFRSDILINGNRVNYHVIFSDQLDPDDIEEHFLSRLTIVSESAPGSPDSQLSLSEKSMTRLGKQLKQQHAKFACESDLFIGMMNATVPLSQATACLENNPALFKDKFLIILPADEDLSKVSWDGQGHQTRKLMIQKAHGIFSGNQKTREVFLGKKHPSIQDYLAEFKSLKPCFHGCDAHGFDKLFEPDHNKYCWIKAIPSFSGLRQTLIEPEHRVFVGEHLPLRDDLALRRTRTIDRITVKSTDEETDSSFDLDLKLSPQLVAIIGNKGNGKSALADIIALAGGTRKVDYFSFLKKDRFRDPKLRRAKSHEAQLHWADGSAGERISLQSDPANNQPEKVRYLPQEYLERACNDVTYSEESIFYQELLGVIFDHIPSEEKGGFENLEALLKSKRAALNEAISNRTFDLETITERLIRLRGRATPSHRQTLELNLNEKRRELEALDASKPPEVTNPSQKPDESGHMAKLARQLEERKLATEQLSDEIGRKKSRLTELNQQLQTCKELLDRIANARESLGTTSQKLDRLAANLSLPIPVLKYEFFDAPIEKHYRELNSEKTTIALELSTSNPESLTTKLAELEENIKAIANKLGEPQALYQKYASDLKIWEEARSSIVGDTDQAGSIAYLEAQLAELENIPTEEGKLIAQRDTVASSLYDLRSRLKDVFEAHCSSVQQYLDGHSIIKRGHLDLAFRAEVRDTGLRELVKEFLSGRRQADIDSIDLLIENSDWSTPEGFLNACRALDEFLKTNDVKLKPTKSLTDLTALIFSGSYLQPVYHLTFDGKPLHQLSPGERGNLLLVFYLLLDRQTTPLIIDQPEENLDNQTIVRVLVPCIIEAKQRRQLIIVTHNPNLAVVCDAEQIVVARVEKGAIPRFSYLAGAIEDEQINKQLLDVLEGTRPAFDIRDSKYLQFKTPNELPELSHC